MVFLLQAKLQAITSGFLASMRKAKDALIANYKEIRKNDKALKKYKERAMDVFRTVAFVATGAFFAMAIASPGLNAQLQLMGVQFEELARTLGDRLVPIFKVLVEVVTIMVDVFQKLPKPVQTFIAVLIIVLPLLSLMISLFGSLWSVIVVLGPGLIALAGYLSSVATALLGVTIAGAPVILIILGIIAVILVVILVIKNWDKITKWFSKNFGDEMEWVADRVGKALSTIITTYLKWRDAFTKAFWAFLKGIWKAIVWLSDTVAQGWYTFWNGLLEIGTTIGSKIVDAIKTVAKGIADIFKDLADSALEWGKHLIEQFIEGIKQMADKAKETAKDVAEKIEDVLGFSLPKEGPLREIPTWGKHMAEQYAGGFSRRFEDLTGSMAQVVATPLISQTPGANLSQTTITNNISFPFEFNVSGASQIDLIAEEVVRRITDSLRGRIGVF